MEAASEPKKRGRPAGSKNKPALVRPEDEARLVPPSSTPKADYQHPDPDALVSRMLSLLDWQMQALRNEMTRAYQSKGVSIDVKDIERLEKLSNTLVRSINALKQSHELAEELAKSWTPEQFLERAALKIEGQDAATLRYYIKRFRAHLEKISPSTAQDRQQMGEPAKLRTGADAIAALED